MGKVFYNQKGYVGQSMSKRALDSYDHGEMPKSKWTKKSMIETINEFLYLEDRNSIIDFNKMKKEELFLKF